MAESQIIINYYDTEENFQGWLVIDQDKYALSAGGIRVQKGLTAQKLAVMAQNMTKKMAIWGLPINGAKCGIDYDPNNPNKNRALRKFIKAIKPFVLTNYSMGADLNTRMVELDAIARELKFNSVKQSIQNVQQLSSTDFEKQISKLDELVDENITVGQIRAGWGVGSAAIELLYHTELGKKISVQGFGTLAKGALFRLKNEPVILNAISDIDKCLVDTTGQGIDIEYLLKVEGNILPSQLDGVEVIERDSLLIRETDILILAATENAVNDKNKNMINSKGIVQGANLAVTNEAIQALHERGILVTPSFVSGSAGTLFMNVLFGSEPSASVSDLLQIADKAMRHKIKILIEQAKEEGTTLENIATTYIENKLRQNIQGKPYSLTYIQED